MRVVLIGQAGHEGAPLADQLNVPLLESVDEASAHHAGFVLVAPVSVSAAVDLDMALARQGVDVDSVVLYAHDDSAAHGEVLEYYRGRLVEVDLDHAPRGAVEGILDGLREALVAG